PPKYGTLAATLTCADSRQSCVANKRALTAREGMTGKKLREYDPGFVPTVVTCAGKVLLVCDLRISPAVATKVAVLEKGSGAIIWTRPGAAHPPVEGGVAFVVRAGELEAVEIATGKTLWQTQTPVAAGAPRACCKGGVVYVTHTEPWKPAGLLVAHDAATGALLWQMDKPPCGYGLFPYRDELWMLQYVSGSGKDDSVQAKVLDPRTGQIRRDFRAKGIVNNKCFPGKGCADYLLYSSSWTLERTSGATLGQNTVRAPCQLGQMPANGLTYYLPHHCDCHVTLRGLLAMSRSGARKWLSDVNRDVSPRLFTHGKAPAPQSEQPTDWPIYRRDTKRSNFTTATLPHRPTLRWTQKLGNSPLTQAVSAYGIVYTTEPQTHRVIACDAARGHLLWQFVADGRTEWSPALHKGLCLFSTAAGSVYALDARNGKLVWRLRAAPVEKYIAEEGQFASAWAVSGGVLPLDGAIFCACGRSAGSDDGMWLFGADAATGQIRWRTRGGTSGDMLLSDGKNLMLTKVFYRPSDGSKVEGPGKCTGLLHTTHYFTAVSVLDYMACVEPLLSSHKHIELTDGRITGENLAFSDNFGVAAWRYRFGVPKEMMKKEKANQRFIYAAAEGKTLWLLDEGINQQMVGIVLAADTAFWAGVPTSLKPEDKAELWVVAAKDGMRLHTLQLPTWPVYDGLSAAAGRLYLATQDGLLVCLGAAEQ
ncbi:MAG: outer membrane protein assembly factor BamB family protein, partial [Kiritimatiellia bacterium]